MHYLLGTVLTLFLFVGGALKGQVAQPAQPNLLNSEEVSDQQIDQFVDAMQYAQKVQQESQPKMIKAIQDEGLEPQKFIQAAQAIQQGKETGLNEDDEKKFMSVQKKVEDIQLEINSQIESKIKEKNLTLDKFNQIYLSYQQNPELKKRIEDQLKSKSQ